MKKFIRNIASNKKQVFIINISLIRTSLVLVIILCSAMAMAHEGGHYHKEDGDILNTWHLKEGGEIQGNFSMGADGIIMLEQYEGKIVSVRVEALSEQDQKLARYEIQRFVKLNEGYAPKSEIPEPRHKELRYPYLVLSVLLAFVALLMLIKGFFIYKKVKQGQPGLAMLTACLSMMLVTIYACKKSTDSIVQAIPKTTTGFIDSAFAPYKPAVSTRWDDTYFYVSSNGFPAHNMMVGITSWQQQVPIPQPYSGSNSWSIPLQPVYADFPLSTKTNLMKGAVAIAVNGIPIFNALNNRGVDSYAIGELDNWGGHCGRADDYHYHAAPLHLSAVSGSKPIAFALDGFPVYGSREPDGSSMQSLDTCHGHIGTNGVYHYHGTTTYPYVVGAMKGKVTLDITTPAPENQILPQAFASPLRPATNPLNGATITDFISTGINAYKLTYKIGTKFGYVEYNWDASNKYTYKLTDTAGVVTINVYQR